MIGACPPAQQSPPSGEANLAEIRPRHPKRVPKGVAMGVCFQWQSPGFGPNPARFHPSTGGKGECCREEPPGGSFQGVELLQWAAFVPG
eukprot:3100007-Prymnesium_polylepis.2